MISIYNSIHCTIVLKRCEIRHSNNNIYFLFFSQQGVVQIRLTEATQKSKETQTSRSGSQRKTQINATFFVQIGDSNKMQIGESTKMYTGGAAQNGASSMMDSTDTEYDSSSDSMSNTYSGSIHSSASVFSDGPMTPPRSPHTLTQNPPQSSPPVTPGTSPRGTYDNHDTLPLPRSSSVSNMSDVSDGEEQAVIYENSHGLK